MSGRDRIAAARLGVIHARNALEKADAQRAIAKRQLAAAQDRLARALDAAGEAARG